MNDRLQLFLSLESLSPARLADIMGIQRSGLSHILSGRNKPGYDFLYKFLKKFPNVNAEWLLTGKGKPYKEVSPMVNENSNTTKEEISIDDSLKEQNLFSDDNFASDKNSEQLTDLKEDIGNIQGEQPHENQIFNVSNIVGNKKRRINKVIILYDDESFEELYPKIH
jgi:Helix-turn-helix.